ncbi:uncharacterized protein SPPG_02098 [Spizellomyces punctatus DAOM BR117]|uniref:ubiquitinyl hydrolase 1 n=1 Tax=Spizellomyces punctatus (strain DAOM BR117) TaxID=645134 RepID=A0A0L0HPP7_SPIPD|nr:uncharacterized protein SPPG_02098 [Spizellomyces punctatus DAOM BR117]KND03028.1 hypothetical protein SPPG_02098 [Spizellomyces punctatus DAOM BR117]|eukprot:XP_016611067.1 hypothetical protein SPPG_02098 [Spizellomyces punctatus DAOM BR117]
MHPSDTAAPTAEQGLDQQQQPIENGADTGKDDRPSDEEILRYERAIKEAETGASPLISDILGMQGLEKEFASGLEIFQRKVKHLSQTCKGMRTVKRDGNCFYRALSFRFCELLWERRGTPWAQAALARAASTKDIMTEMGYDMSLLIDFWEPFETALKPQEDSKTLLEIFQTEYVSDTIVCYLRLVTAAVLKKYRDLFEAFILDSYPSLDAFIGSQVEPMNIEADQPHIVAISNALGITIRIANLDPTPTDAGVNYHELSPMEPLEVPGDVPEVVLLYRPGHYDVLYPSG